MSTAHHVFADKLQKAEEWLDELTEIGGFVSPEQAYTVLHAVLPTLRDRLTVDEGAHLASHLPLLVRGIYYDGWKPAAAPQRQRSKPQFLGAVEARLRGGGGVEPEPACRAVFRLIDRHVPRGEVQDVRRMMHSSLDDLWPQD